MPPARWRAGHPPHVWRPGPVMTRLMQTVLTPLTWPVAAGWAAVLLLGLSLLWAGWRGRRINDHPICRKCRFDLIGIYGPGAARMRGAGLRCPECGAVIAGEGARRAAVRNGVRRRRWLVGTAGLLFVAVGVAALGWLGYREARAYDWNRAKPVWWILKEVESPSAVPYSALMDELVRRAGAGRLSKGQYLRIAPLTRARQADLSKAWDPRWGHLIESGYEQGRVDDHEFNRYLNGLIQGTLKVRPKVRAGAPLPAVLKFELRGGSLAWSMFAGAQRELMVAGKDYSKPVRTARLAAPLDTSNADINSLGPRYWSKPLGKPFNSRYGTDIVDLSGTAGLTAKSKEFQLFAPGPTGDYTIKAAWRFRLDTSIERATDVPRAVAMLAKRVFEPEYTATFTVVGADAPTAKLGKETYGAAAMSECFAARRADPRRLDGEFHTSVAPRPYAFDVYALFAGREVYIGSLAPIPDDPLDSADTRQFILNEEVPEGAAVSYVLRPSIRAAELTVDLEEIWGEEIIVQEGPVIPVRKLYELGDLGAESKRVR